MKNNSLYFARLHILKENRRKKKSAKIADYILSNLENIERFTLESISAETNTGYVTVCRFLKELGVSGIREFKKIMLAEKEKQNNLEVKLNNYDPNPEESMTYSAIRTKICDFSSSVVANCNNTLDEDKIIIIINMFNNAGFVYFVGMGTSAVTALYAHTKMLRLKLNCACDSDVIISKMKASMMKKNDILFAISSSGRTKPIVDIAKIARQNGAKVISISDFIHSQLAELSDICIYTTIRDSNKYLDIDFPLIQGQITIIDILYSCMYSLDNGISSAYLKKTTSAVISDKIRY